MKCKYCNSEWQTTIAVKTCPFCGKTLMEQHFFSDIEQALRYIMDTYGESVNKNPSSLIAYLGDLAPQLTNERRLLKMCADAGIIAELISVTDQAERSLAVKRAVTVLSGTYFLDAKWAERAVGWLTVTMTRSSSADVVQSLEEQQSEAVSKPTTVLSLPPASVPKTIHKAVDTSMSIVEAELASQSALVLNTQMESKGQLVSGPGQDMEIKNGVLAKYCGPGGDVVIPESVTIIGDSAFEEDEDSRKFWHEWMKKEFDLEELEDYRSKSVVNITIPIGVTTIGKRAFLKCESLTSVTIPEGVTTIDEYAFFKCKSLASITIPKSVTVIGKDAFAGCKSLTSVTIPEGVTTISKGAFRGCEELISVTISEGVIAISDEAFYNCESLTSVTIPESVITIGYCAFAGCQGLRDISIPKSTKIERNAFMRTSRLEIYTPAQSYAHKYAEENNIPIKLINHATGRRSGTGVELGPSKKESTQVERIRKRREELKQYAGRIVCGRNHILALRSDGTVIAYGDNDAGQCNVEGWRDVTAIASSFSASVGLTAMRTMLCTDSVNSPCPWQNIVQITAWGSTPAGLCADGTVVANVSDMRDKSVIGWKNVTAIASSAGAIYGLLADGTVAACGNNKYGQCDVGDWRNVISIAGSELTVYGIRKDGQVYAQGCHDNGQCDAVGWRDIIDIVSGNGYVYGVKSDGSVVYAGQGLMTHRGVCTWTDIVAFASGSTFVAGLKADGTVVTLMHGFYNSCDTSSWRDIVAIACGNEYVVGLQADGIVLFAGKAKYGEDKIAGQNLFRRQNKH